MPGFAPRTEPEKKQEELSKRESGLLHAIKKNLSAEKISVAAEKYRKAQLSLVKAKIQVAMDKVYKQHLPDFDFSGLAKESEKWNKKTVDEIISDFKALNKITDHN